MGTLGGLGRVLVTAHRSSLRSLDAGSFLAAAFGRTSACSAGARAFSSTPAAAAPPPPDSSHASDLAQQLLQSSTELGSFAAQPLEPLSQFLNPFVLGSSAWEMVHSASGLPWWASIPLTTLALRTAVLPLTLKAKSAALNWILLQHSFQTANRLLEQMQQAQPAAPAGSRQQQSDQQQQQQQQLKKPGKLKLVRMYYRYFRKQQRTTSMWWWFGNAAVQANLFIVMSVALRQMCDAQWPGLASQGLWWFTDLTQPSVMLGTWVCPYGVSGVLLPFGMLALYLKTVEQSPAVRSPHVKLLLDCGALPYFMLSCLVPQATLLYWTGNSLFFYGMQAALQRPAVARAVGLPSMMLPKPRGAKEEKERAEQEAVEARQLICGSEDDGFLRFLASNYMARGLHQQAIQCLQRLTVLAPGDVAAFSALGRTAAELHEWPVAAAAYQRSAELHAATGEVEEQATELVLSGKHWLNAVAEARQLQQAAAKDSSKAGSSKKASSSSSSDSLESRDGDAAGSKGSQADAAASSSSSSSSSIDKVHADKQQEYISSALTVLHTAVALPAEAAVEGWYLLAMARAAAGQREGALAASHTYWSQACAKASDDATAKSNAAAKLLPVLANLCKQHWSMQHHDALLGVAGFAVEVAQSGWDRQSQEQLHERLGAAAQEASQQGRFAYAEQLRQLQQQLPLLGAASGKQSNWPAKFRAT